jgi:CHRD domain
MNFKFICRTVAAVAVLFTGLSTNAAVITYTGTFAPEATGATGTGSLVMTYDSDLLTLGILANWSGLSGTTTTAHIHCCTAAPRAGTAGVALAQGGILPGFPLGATSGTYSRVIDLTQSSQFGAAFVTSSGGTVSGAASRLISNLSSGNAYFNIHSSTFAGGEIRAFVTATQVPLPGSAALVLAALAGAFVTRKQRGAV